VGFWVSIGLIGSLKIAWNASLNALPDCFDVPSTAGSAY
jgi:hypothetical protein